MVIILIEYLTIIPARKNSKRIKRKNIVLIKKKELITYTFKHAIGSNYKKNIVVNTDDEKIIKLSKQYNLNFLERPKRLSGSNTSTEDVVNHTLKTLFGKSYFKKVKNVILLQPTSPLRTIKNVNQAKRKFKKGNYDSLFSGFLSKKFIWTGQKKLKSISYNFKRRRRTQDMQNLIFENGAIFIFNTRGFYIYKNRLFGKIGFFEMEERQSVDLDTNKDLSLLKKIMV